ncbi:hypothetical protein E2P81_ATG02288 [Venturia nashicola]|uniref:Uncharacterized protein n=1 Tax=Venturia nashicola TaxID=86259 RepID=A0A4Z1PKH4_9PEZI|nr:hypothetical protein E6O75_ATG02345 [Venturia nashicola]TLD36506.1 hypothetical protein E2P81_ATG02288 [Venturia nashicola]
MALYYFDLDLDSTNMIGFGIKELPEYDGIDVDGSTDVPIGILLVQLRMRISNGSRSGPETITHSKSDIQFGITLPDEFHLASPGHREREASKIWAAKEDVGPGLVSDINYPALLKASLLRTL